MTKKEDPMVSPLHSQLTKESNYLNAKKAHEFFSLIECSPNDRALVAEKRIILIDLKDYMDDLQKIATGI
ncbi:MAG: hypothetical protein V3R67_08930 [Thermodesulfobacteriota bacterium]